MRAVAVQAGMADSLVTSLRLDPDGRMVMGSEEWGFGTSGTGYGPRDGCNLYSREGKSVSRAFDLS